MCTANQKLCVNCVTGKPCNQIYEPALELNRLWLWDKPDLPEKPSGYDATWALLLDVRLKHKHGRINRNPNYWPKVSVRNTRE